MEKEKDFEIIGEAAALDNAVSYSSKNGSTGH
jgi:hypothetical protein